MRLSAIRKELKVTAAAAAAALLLPAFSPGLEAFSWWAGYGLGFLAVTLHYLLALRTFRLPAEELLSGYYLGTALRFLVVLSLFLILLVRDSVAQIPFTLSFIISYIFHSVIDVILIDKILADKSSHNR